MSKPGRSTRGRLRDPSMAPGPRATILGAGVLIGGSDEPERPGDSIESERRGIPNEPCLAKLWHEGGAPTPCTGWARGVGDRNEPRDLSPLLSMIPPRCSSEPERLVGASP